MFVSKTPLRVSFFGGGTDYPEYFQDNPSAVLGGTINKYIYTTALPLAPFADQKFRVSYKIVEDCNTVDEISHPVIREVLKLFNYDTPTGFYTVSDIPGSTGLGSSSSFSVGFIKLLEDMSRTSAVRSRSALAYEAIRLERDVLGENVGVQDQTHAAFGGLARYDFTMTENMPHIEQSLINMPTSRLQLLNQSMILVYTNIQRHASSVVSAQVEGMKEGSNIDYLTTMYNMVADGQAIFEREGNDTSAIADIGNLLNESWKLKQNLGKGVTNETVNDIYNTGIDMGAYGGKLLGAGGGGFVMLLVNPDDIPKFQNEFGVKNVIPVNFTNSKAIVQSF